jgi:SP family myo-inositol transporter-like MFS transporter 13
MIKVLKKIYNGDAEWIAYEIGEIEVGHAQQQKDKEIYGDGLVVSRIFATPHIRKALFIGCALQAFQQLSGINTIM